ncbi:hypothetical protein HDV05_003779 [Chytridiales sp. JEL 0842]|nr:hypothetical protein HDV05_003779 [Chytridiales sp. JEL 0842]
MRRNKPKATSRSNNAAANHQSPLGNEWYLNLKFGDQLEIKTSTFPVWLLAKAIKYEASPNRVAHLRLHIVGFPNLDQAIQVLPSLPTSGGASIRQFSGDQEVLDRATATSVAGSADNGDLWDVHAPPTLYGLHDREERQKAVAGEIIITEVVPSSLMAPFAPSAVVPVFQANSRASSPAKSPSRATTVSPARTASPVRAARIASPTKAVTFAAPPQPSVAAVAPAKEPAARTSRRSGATTAATVAIEQAPVVKPTNSRRGKRGRTESATEDDNKENPETNSVEREAPPTKRRGRQLKGAPTPTPTPAPTEPAAESAAAQPKKPRRIATRTRSASPVKTTRRNIASIVTPRAPSVSPVKSTQKVIVSASPSKAASKPTKTAGPSGNAARSSGTSWQFNLKWGTDIEVYSNTDKLWYPARAVSYNTPDKLRVHFLGWPRHYDETVDLGTSEGLGRIRQPEKSKTEIQKMISQNKQELAAWDIEGAKPYGLNKVQVEAVLRGEVVVKAAHLVRRDEEK